MLEARIVSQEHIEIEVKIKVENLAAVEWKLKAAGATLKAGRVHERNVRYEDSGETFTAAARVLRLRQDTQVHLTYKEPHDPVGGDAWARTELEVTVSDFETADLLLHKLGFHVAWIYEKYRTTYEFEDCEVVLDEMPFGAFIEVEGQPDAIQRALAALGLADAPRITASYSDLFFRLKARLGLPFRDLTFEDFRNITIPGDMNW
jgi:adenylate cyclase class 2